MTHIIAVNSAVIQFLHLKVLVLSLCEQCPFFLQISGFVTRSVVLYCYITVLCNMAFHRQQYLCKQQKEKHL